jgi:hypothetical protein
MSIIVNPFKTNSPFPVDTDTHLPFSIFLQRFQLIGIGDFQISDICCGMKNLELAFCADNQYRRDSWMPVSHENGFGHLIFEGLYQTQPYYLKKYANTFCWYVKEKKTASTRADGSRRPRGPGPIRFFDKLAKISDD